MTSNKNDKDRYGSAPSDDLTALNQEARILWAVFLAWLLLWPLAIIFTTAR